MWVYGESDKYVCQALNRVLETITSTGSNLLIVITGSNQLFADLKIISFILFIRGNPEINIRMT